MYTGILVLACVAGISDARRIVPLAGKSMPRNFAESPVAHQKVLANLLSAFDPVASFNPSGGGSGYALLPGGVTRHRSVLMGTKGPFNSKHSDQRRWVPSRRDLLKAAALTSLGYTLGPKSVLAASGVDYAAVSGSIADLVKADPDKGPTFVRLAWHSSGTYDKMAKDGGSGGGTIRFKEELAHGANAGLTKATEWLEPLHSKYKGISYADLYTLAGVSAIAAMGGPKIGWGFGRVDAMDPSAVTPDGRLPAADKGSSKETATGLRDIFYRMGFNDQEIVALSGAHALGRCHPDASGYEGPWTPTPTLFTNSYFGLLQNLKWTKRDWSGPLQYEDPSKKLMMLPSDIVLLEDAEFAKYVKLYAKDSKTFNADFANAFRKLEELGTKGLTSVVL